LVKKKNALWTAGVEYGPLPKARVYQEHDGQQEYKQRKKLSQIHAHTPGILGAAQNTLHCFSEGNGLLDVEMPAPSHGLVLSFQVPDSTTL
jgi:hypothetical protein